MDPVSLVVGALAAGASAGLSDTAKSAIGDLYARVRSRLTGRPAGVIALEEHATDPDTWAAPLAKELEASDVEGDAELLALAQQVMAQIDPTGSQAGKYIVNLAGARGVQVGDHNTQTNTFDD
jgi:hypothetical protein